jgi:hypothetical protein
MQGEEGIASISDDKQHLHFVFGLWNGTSLIVLPQGRITCQTICVHFTAC